MRKLLLAVSIWPSRSPALLRGTFPSSSLVAGPSYIIQGAGEREKAALFTGPEVCDMTMLHYNFFV